MTGAEFGCPRGGQVTPRVTGSFIEVIVVEVEVTAVTNPGGLLKTVMKKTMLVILVVLVAGAVAMAQNPYTQGTGIQGVDKLGAHQNGGRGCTGCHAPHSGSFGAGGNAITGQTVDTANAGNYLLVGPGPWSALWVCHHPGRQRQQRRHLRHHSSHLGAVFCRAGRAQRHHDVPELP